VTPSHRQKAEALVCGFVRISAPLQIPVRSPPLTDRRHRPIVTGLLIEESLFRYGDQRSAYRIRAGTAGTNGGKSGPVRQAPQTTYCPTVLGMFDQSVEPTAFFQNYCHKEERTLYPFIDIVFNPDHYYSAAPFMLRVRAPLVSNTVWLRLAGAVRNGGKWLSRSNRRSSKTSIIFGFSARDGRGLCWACPGLTSGGGAPLADGMICSVPAAE
jgi:hypothetical protein